MPMITGPGAFDPLLGKMRTKDVSGGTASGDYTFNTAEFTVGVAGLVSLNQVPASKFDTVLDIVNVTGASVTLQPNTAYKIYATSQAITLNANPPAAGKWAYEGHIELFVAGTGYVVTGTNVVLANALEPDAVNNCTVRFHDGIAIIAVEDHIAGYIVTVASGTTSGSLYYGLATASNEYIAVDASLNGTTLDLGGAVAEGEKHIVGNGYNETAITGAVDCGTSKFTVANLGLSNVQVTGGVMTLGDTYIPSGSIVEASGALLFEHAQIDGTLIASANARMAAGGVITGGGIFKMTNPLIQNWQTISWNVNGNGLVLSGFSSTVNGPLNGANIMPNCAITGCTVTGFSAYNGAVFITGSNTESNAGRIESCTFSGNSGDPDGATAATINYAYFKINNCTFENGESIKIGSGGKLLMGGHNKTKSTINGTENGTLTLSSGAILDLTGNTNATPIAPGGGVIVDGGCTVINSAGASVSIAGGTYTQINNDGTTE